LRSKKNEYAQFVKEVYLPQVSEKKQQELLEIKARLKHPVRNSHKVSPGGYYEPVNEMDLEYSEDN
jgi:hypothetical protein